MHTYRSACSRRFSQRFARNSASRKLTTLLLFFNMLIFPSPALLHELKALVLFAVTVSLAYSRANSNTFLSLFQSKPPCVERILSLIALLKSLAYRFLLANSSAIKVRRLTFPPYPLTLMIRPSRASASSGNLPTLTRFRLMTRAAPICSNPVW